MFFFHCCNYQFKREVTFDDNNIAWLFCSTILFKIREIQRNKGKPHVTQKNKCK